MGGIFRAARRFLVKTPEWSLHVPPTVQRNPHLTIMVTAYVSGMFLTTNFLVLRSSGLENNVFHVVF